ncbi:MAG: GTP-binding protein [Promethearchaeota archaeon]
MTVDYLFKIIVVGDGAVGKTTLTKKFVTGKFQSQYKMTIGVDLSIKILKIKQNIIKLQIWDTGGQERFQYVSPIYYRGALGALCCYDITQRTSFENLPKWFSNVENYCGNIPIVLVATKKDLEDFRIVKEDEGHSFAREKGIYFFETSAKREFNLEKPFLAIAKQIAENVKHVKS